MNIANYDNRVAEVFGALVIHGLGFRLRRLLWLTSCWPGMTFRMLISDDAAREVITLFRSDTIAKAKLDDVEDQPAALKKLLARHVLHLAINKQW